MEVLAIHDSKDLIEITYNYEKDGVFLRRELDKKILSNTGIWADIAFLYQDLNLATADWKSPKITIARFKKVDGVWTKQSHFHINGQKRADQIIATLSVWRERLEA